MRIFYRPYWGRFLLTTAGIFWLLNYLINSAGIYLGTSFFPFPFPLGFSYFCSTSLLAYFYSSFLAFCYYFFLAVSLFYSFLNCCLDSPILSPSDRVSGSFCRLLSLIERVPLQRFIFIIFELVKLCCRITFSRFLKILFVN